jgi:hypothetical protein
VADGIGGRSDATSHVGFDLLKGVMCPASGNNQTPIRHLLRNGKMRRLRRVDPILLAPERRFNRPQIAGKSDDRLR